MRLNVFQWFLFLSFFAFSETGAGAFPVTPMPSTPATLTGVVTDAITGAPVTGAKITVNNQSAWSVSGGGYTLSIEPVGTYTVKFQKAGFDSYTSPAIAFQSGVTVTMNMALWENLNPPYTAAATLDSATQVVSVSWELPRGDYEALYDDGLQDDFFVWATQGNMSAVRFTPVAFPARVKGGMVHIGTQANYPPGSNPFIPFQISVYDAGGSQGMPGNKIAGPFDVTPTKFGWNEFTFPSSVALPGGNFYLVMIQGGNAPNATGLAVDNTVPKMRSVIRHMTGGGGWLPASGNFMMRAILFGPGGPLNADSLSESLIQYQVWRLRQGEEQNQAVWVDLGATTGLSATDPAWASLPCSPYRWAVKTLYSGSRWSPARFSNVLGKCWTVAVTVDLDLSCEAADKSGAFIRMRNLVYPDTLYTVTVDTSGHHTFPMVWRGSYELIAKKFGYKNDTTTISLVSDTTVAILLLQENPPPSNLQVDPKTLVAQWDIPAYSQPLFTEDWNSGSFLAQGWSVLGGTNWSVSSVIGHPAPSAMFSWLPLAMNYEQILTSKSIAGIYSPLLSCSYDIFLDNFATTSLNQMAVEISDGSSWVLLKNYTNAGGSFPWKTEQVDISPYADKTFQIRFRAYGEDTYDINGWNIDNITVRAAETTAGLVDCILGYNFYLDNVLSGFTPDTKYIIPGPQVQYGQQYTACVLAVYGSGYSVKDCVQFTSTFLYPPRNLTGTPEDNSIYLAWQKPQIPNSGTPPGLIGYRIYRNSVLLLTINDPDVLEYYDMSLEPGTYQYEVSAMYDLTDYGFPGQSDESMKAGPVIVDLFYGRELPFYEPWDQASFAYNEWRFTPGQGNWVIEVNTGNPAPSARFTWEPVQINYSYGLESTVLDASLLECARIWLAFDLKLLDRYGTGKEKLSVEVFYNNIWHRMTEYLNGGSFNWQHKLIDLSAVAEKAFRIRFRASGMNSSDITGWFLDNIEVYPVCYPALDPEGEVIGNDVLLTWKPPNCAGTGGHLNEGFEGDLFPPSGWDQVILNASATWSHTTAASPLGVHTGNYSAGVAWDYTHQDEWLIVRDILVTGNLTFWSYAYQGSIYNDHYYVKVSPDGGSTWDVVLDMSALPPYPSYNGYNQWETPYEADMTLFFGQTVDIAWQAVDGDGQGLWYSWAIDDCSMETDALVKTDYDIYRQEGDTGDFLKINSVPVQDTAYLDEDLLPQQYRYYIVALSPGCQQSEPSDTILVDLITEADAQATAEDILIYPNPARQQIHIRSSGPIRSLALFTSEGRSVLDSEKNRGCEATISVAGLPEGLYFLRVITTSGSSARKIIITD